MTVEDKRGASKDEDGVNDQFPVGMRVLAVDDDPICLKVIETLLRKCKYHVTVTNQAAKALQMLRENINNYDLVISDVDMPDIDGFKLLELVGLKMDLPVIMLSAHSDTKLVMKGIRHGACDYLLKPVRYEELKNIWQHVIRRKKVESKDQNISVNQDKACLRTWEVGQGATSHNTDQDAKTNTKRKDQNEDVEDECEDNEDAGDDSGTQKKPRVVWSAELHSKFIAAVGQLGLDKAVPKKILDLMDVEGLTRENVASHLQKYRIHLKKFRNMTSQQAFGSKDNTYLGTGSLGGFNDFRSFAGQGMYLSTSPSHYPNRGTLGRLNSPATLTLRGITSSGMVQPGPLQNFSNSINSLSKFQSMGLPSNETTNLLQEVPTSLELNQLQQSKGINSARGFSPIENSNAFTAITSIPDARVGLGSSSNTTNTSPRNSLLFQGNAQQTENRMLFGGCNDGWQNAVQFSSDLLSPLNEQLPLTKFRENASSSNLQLQSSPIDFSLLGAHSQAAGCSRDMDSQAGLVGSFFQNMSYAPEKRWEEQRQDYSHNLVHNYSTVDPHSSANGISDPLHDSMGQNNAISIENIDTPINGGLNGGASVPQQGDFAQSNASYMLDQTQFQDGFIHNNYDSLDDLMSSMVKRTDSLLMDGELGFDPYSLGSCM